VKLIIKKFMFCDYTKIHVESGKGGDGCLSFRREKYIAKGGPDGGNGGKGGDVIIRATRHKNSLIDLHTKKIFKARKGEGGAGWKKNGVAGEDLTIEVPLGTVIKDELTDEIIADLKEDNEAVLIVKGGRGGYGNEHFKSATRQTPRFAELGEIGEERDLILELKLVADVGIIGLPSAGKSTLISAITSAKPKIADYPFTTLIPNLGVAKIRDSSLVIADIPGLIEGASEGKGLGDEFLRHISRNSILIHVIDIEEDLAKAYHTIQKELKNYKNDLSLKTQIIAINKADSKDPELEKMLEKEFREKTKTKDPVFFISAAGHIGLQELLDKTLVKCQELKELEHQKAETEVKSEEYTVFEPQKEESNRYYKISEEKSFKDQENPQIKRRLFKIHGARINQIAIMTNYDQREGVDRLWDVFKKLGIWKDLDRLGAEEKDRISFVRFEKMIPYRELI
jgi:GTP-binding protein